MSHAALDLPGKLTCRLAILRGQVFKPGWSRSACAILLLIQSGQSLTLPPLTQPSSAHAFSSTASWLVPGIILCGRYPGSCPSRPCDVETQRNRLAIIREHADTFVCLQEEVPPQDAEWPPGGVGAQSGNAAAPQMAKFQRYYEAAGGTYDEVAGAVTFLHFGIADRSVAKSLEALDAVVFDLRRRALNGDRLYLHCWGGRGRTGLVAACLLGALYPELVDAEEALQRVHSYYRLREPDKGGASPETEEQKKQVRDWYYWVKGGGVRIAKQRRGGLPTCCASDASASDTAAAVRCATTSFPKAHSRGTLSVNVAALPGGLQFVCSSSYDGSVKLWALPREGQSDLRLLHSIEDDEGAVFTTAMAPTEKQDGLLLCIGNYQRRVRAWRYSAGSSDGALQSTPRELWSSAQHTGWVRSLAMATSRRDSIAPERLFSIGCNRILGWTLDGSSSSSNGEKAADAPTAERRRCCELILYEEDDESEEQYRSHDILCLAHSTEEQQLASGSVDGALRVWSTAELPTLDELEAREAEHWLGHAGSRVACVAWSAGGELLSCGYDGLVRSWRRRSSSSDEAAALPSSWELAAEARVVAGSGGRALTLATGGVDGAVVLCGTSEGALIALRADDLSVLSRSALPASGTSGELRATAVAALPELQTPAGELGSRQASFVVGDSEGGLHVHAVLMDMEESKL